MKLGYDIQALYSGSASGGIGRYCYHFLHKMFELYPKNEYVLFTNSLQRKEKPFPEASNITYRTINYLPDHGLNPINGLLQYANYYAQDLDLIHVLSPLEFTIDTVVSTNLLKGKSVLTLYDLIPLRYSPFYLNSGGSRQDYLNKIQMYQRADLVLSISEWSSNDAINMLGISPEKIFNIGVAVDDKFKHLSAIPTDSSSSVRHKYELGDHFILYVGSIDVRKNIFGLIDAYNILPQRLRSQYSLIIACNYSKIETASLQTYADRTVGGRIKFIHFLPDFDLNLLYNICDLFVFPSLCEGAGLPVLEAMKCGAPVIAGNNSGIPEMVGRVDNLFVAESPFRMANMMAKALCDQDFANELRYYGISRGSNYTWDRVVNSAVQAYNACLNRNRKEEYKRREATPKDYKLGIVSTWNTKCGIANYSKYMLQYAPGLTSDRCVIFTRTEKEIVSQDSANVIRCWQNQGDLSSLTSEILRHNPDIVDVMYNYSFFTLRQLARLIMVLKQHNIKVIVSVHDPLQNDPTGESLKEMSVDLNLADAIIVFNEDQARELKTSGVTTEISYIPQGILRYPDEDRCTARKARGFSNTKIIASTGFLLPHKGILEVIQALPILVETHSDLLYLVVCSLHLDPSSQLYYEECINAVHSLGLEKHVKFITEYLEEKDVMALLHTADMTLLPYTRTQQPTSAGLRFALSALRPAITTDIPIFGEFGPEVFKIHGCEPNVIAAAVNTLYSDEKVYQDLMEATRKRIESDCWESLSQRHIDLIQLCLSKAPSDSLKWLGLIDELSEMIQCSGMPKEKSALSFLSKAIYDLQR